MARRATSSGMPACGEDPAYADHDVGTAPNAETRFDMLVSREDLGGLRYSCSVVVFAVRWVSQ